MPTIVAVVRAGLRAAGVARRLHRQRADSGHALQPDGAELEPHHRAVRHLEPGPAGDHRHRRLCHGDPHGRARHLGLAGSAGRRGRGRPGGRHHGAARHPPSRHLRGSADLCAGGGRAPAHPRRRHRVHRRPGRSLGRPGAVRSPLVLGESARLLLARAGALRGGHAPRARHGGLAVRHGRRPAPSGHCGDSLLRPRGRSRRRAVRDLSTTASRRTSWRSAPWASS